MLGKGVSVYDSMWRTISLEWSLRKAAMNHMITMSIVHFPHYPALGVPCLVSKLLKSKVKTYYPTKKNGIRRTMPHS